MRRLLFPGHPASAAVFGCRWPAESYDSHVGWTSLFLSLLLTTIYLCHADAQPLAERD
jgi:hypothetical protein